MKEPEPGSYSENRAFSAWQRGWINASQLDDCIKDGRREGTSSLAILGGKGLLDGSQLARLLGGEVLPGVALETGISEEEPYRAGDCLAGKFHVFGLAEGGFGRVLFCEVAGTDRQVAMKTLRRFHLRDPGTVRSFSAEARRWLQIGAHPHIVRCLGLEEIGGQPFLCMEYVPGGRTLQDEIAAGPCDWRRTLRLGLQLAQGLAFCERVTGLVHGDIKPLNILVTPDGKAKLTDFGISYARLHETDETPHAGTPGYCAPELLAGRRRSTASDIYAYGMTLWQLAAGILPRQGDGDPFTGFKKDLALVAPEIPRSFTSLIMACVDEDPARRPGTFRELAHRLTQLHEELLGEPVSYDLPDFNLAGRFEAAVNACNLADTFLAMERFPQALDLAMRAIKLDPKYWLAHDAMGRALLGLRRFEEAAGGFQAALDLQPEDPALHALLAGARWNLGEKEAAEKFLATAIQLARKTGNTGCLDIASAIIVAILPPGPALEIHDAITRDNPAANRSWVNRAALLRMLDKTGEALECARMAVSLNPANACAWGVLSGALSDDGRDAEALEAVERALSYDPADPALHAQKCVVLHHVGREEEAAGQLKNALATWPDSAELRRVASLE